MVVERPTPELLVRRLASLCPFPPAAAKLQEALAPMLCSASLFISPRTYARFVVSLLVIPAPLEALALLWLPTEQAVLMVGAMAMVQAMPVLVLVSRANSRRRAADGELPFFLMTLSVFVHEANPTLQEGFKRVSAIGARVFPAFTREGEILERDDAFVPDSPAGVAERAFAGHPSQRVRAFVRGFLKTLATGKDVSEFVRQETSFQIQKLEQSWTAFSVSVGSLAEVTFILLALFPVGVEMIGASVSGFASSFLFLASFALLAVSAVVFLLMTDAIQPVVYDRPPSALWLAVSLAGWVLSTLAFRAGLLGSREYILVPLCVSLLGYYETRKHYSRIRKGEDEVSSMLHDLAEESKAGVSLPEALSKLSSQAERFSSIKEPVLAFYQATRLGLTPTEAQRRVGHPSWLVRLGFGILSIAFETGAGFEHLEELSSLFRRVADARKSVTQSMIPFMLIGAIVPVISVAAITFLSGFAQQGVPIGLPAFAVQTSQTSLILSVSMVSVLSGVLLSKLLTQTVRHQVALPILMASTLVALLAFGVA
jgi:archaellum biogenesis protein FlaJ (TadC family)